MPQTQVVVFQDEAGTAPLLEWLDTLPKKAQDKCRLRIERLAEVGNELRRPEADMLTDGIYELRARVQNVHYRILYFYAGKALAVLSHGITKVKNVPKKEITAALDHRKIFLENPEKHTYQED